MKQKFFYPVALAAFSLILSGCTIHRGVELNYLPGADSPLSSVSPKSFKILIENHCPPDEKDQLAHINKVILFIEEGPESNIRDALRTEIEKAGHRVVENDADASDATVRVQLTRMIHTMTNRGSNLLKTILISADVSVWKKGEETEASQYQVTELQEKEYVIMATGAIETMLNESFHNFIRTIVLDPGFMAPFE